MDSVGRVSIAKKNGNETQDKRDVLQVLLVSNVSYVETTNNVCSQSDKILSQHKEHSGDISKV